MGHGVFTTSSFASYNTSLGRHYDTVTNYVVGQEYTAKMLDESLDPKKFTIRECANNEEHPNTVPVILALDVTGSMGSACAETAAAIGKIVLNLFEKYKDVEFCIMGIGDLAYDRAPIQMSQFESDVRIAESLDKVYMEHGGGGNAYESYTAAWYMGLHHTKLDCFDKQGRKGVIITMGDEPLNPYLPVRQLNESTNGHAQSDIETNALYEEASKKFDIFHIAIDDHACMYSYYESAIKNTWGKLLGDRCKVSTINELSKTIEDCVAESINNNIPSKADAESGKAMLNENGEIVW
jgi:hypothetical protein